MQSMVKAAATSNILTPRGNKRVSVKFQLAPDPITGTQHEQTASRRAAA